MNIIALVVAKTLAFGSPVAEAPAPQHPALLQIDASIARICEDPYHCTIALHDIIEARYEGTQAGLDYFLYAEVRACLGGALRTIILESGAPEPSVAEEGGTLRIRAPFLEITVLRGQGGNTERSLVINDGRTDLPSFTLLTEWNAELIRRDASPASADVCEGSGEALAPIAYPWTPHGAFLEYVEARLREDPQFAAELSGIVPDPLVHLQTGTEEGRMLYQYLRDTVEFRIKFREWLAERGDAAAT